MASWTRALYNKWPSRKGDRGALTEEMIANLERVKDHPDLTPKLAEGLTTSTVTLTYEVNTDVEIGDEAIPD